MQRLPVPLIGPVKNRPRHRELLQDYRVPPNQVTPVPQVIRAGFIFDGASVPLPAQPFIFQPFDLSVILPALSHDSYYAEMAGSRRIADQVFFWLLLNQGVEWFRARIMYRAVRLFGGAYWPQDPFTPGDDDWYPVDDEYDEGISV